MLPPGFQATYLQSQCGGRIDDGSKHCKAALKDIEIADNGLATRAYNIREKLNSRTLKSLQAADALERQPSDDAK